MTDFTTLCAKIMNCLEQLQNPENVEQSLRELSIMEVTKEAIEATGAEKIVASHFRNPIAGDIARNIAMNWLGIRTPKMPVLLFKWQRDKEENLKRNIDSDYYDDSISPKKIKTVEEENLSSVLDITGDENEKGEEEKVNNPFFNREEYSQMNSKKPPSGAPSSSKTQKQPSTLKKSTKENRLEAISLKIGKKKAETAAKQRKTVALSEHGYAARSRALTGQKK